MDDSVAEIAEMFAAQSPDLASQVMLDISGIDDRHGVYALFTPYLENTFMPFVLMRMILDGNQPLLEDPGFHKSVCFPAITRSGLHKNGNLFHKMVFVADDHGMVEVLRMWTDYIVTTDDPPAVFALYRERSYDPLSVHEVRPGLVASFAASFAATPAVPRGLWRCLYANPDHPYLVALREHPLFGSVEYVDVNVDIQLEAIEEGDFDGVDEESFFTDLALYCSNRMIMGVCHALRKDRTFTKWIHSFDDRVWLDPEMLETCIVPMMPIYDSMFVMRVARLTSERDGALDSTRAFIIVTLVRRILSEDEEVALEHLSEVNEAFPSEVGRVVSDLEEIPSWVVRFFQVREGCAGYDALRGERRLSIISADVVREVVAWTATEEKTPLAVKRLMHYGTDAEVCDTMAAAFGAHGDHGPEMLHYCIPKDRLRNDDFAGLVMATLLTSRTDTKFTVMRYLIPEMLRHCTSMGSTNEHALSMVVDVILRNDDARMFGVMQEALKDSRVLVEVLSRVPSFPTNIAGHMATRGGAR